MQRHKVRVLWKRLVAAHEVLARRSEMTKKVLADRRRARRQISKIVKVIKAPPLMKRQLETDRLGGRVAKRMAEQQMVRRR